MAYSWSYVSPSNPASVVGTKTSYNAANEIRTNTNTLITYLNNPSCTSVKSRTSCSSLANSLPATVSASTKINTSWVTSLQSVISTIHTYARISDGADSAYCATAKGVYCYSDNAGRNATICTGTNHDYDGTYQRGHCGEQRFGMK